MEPSQDVSHPLEKPALRKNIWTPLEWVHLSLFLANILKWLGVLPFQSHESYKTKQNKVVLERVSPISKAPLWWVSWTHASLDDLVKWLAPQTVRLASLAARWGSHTCVPVGRTQLPSCVVPNRARPRFPSKHSFGKCCKGDGDTEICLQRVAVVVRWEGWLGD